MNNPTLKVIGTHNGIFHIDEVVSIAILSLLYDNNIIVKRTRNPKVLNQCDILVDIGGGKYDHHMKGGNGIRHTGTPYASCGLVWKDFGVSLLRKMKCPTEYIDECCCTIDTNYIEDIDKIDNGISAHSVFDFIPLYLPRWDENFSIVDAYFWTSVNCAKSLLHQIIKKQISEVKSNNLINNILLNNTCPIIEIPCQNINWLDKILLYNIGSKHPVDFVVFPYVDGGYAAQAVPPSKDNIFDKRIPFPKSWAGLTTSLPEISGVNTASFCHNNLFFVRAQTKQDIDKLCEIAIKQSNGI